MSNSGVYKIVNNINLKFYIGSSYRLEIRKREHFNALKRGTHCNKYLQRAFNKHGIDSFEFVVIEFCGENKLIEREQYYIDTLKPKYNNRLRAAGLNRQGQTEETKAKKRIKSKEMWRNRSIEERVAIMMKGALKRRKPINQLDMNGHYIKTFESAIAAAKYIGINNSSDIIACCKGKKRLKSTRGYKWEYKNNYKCL